MNCFVLKSIALISMLIDHTGMVLFPDEMWFRIVGRLAFPIYCFLLSEGARHTSNKWKYLVRLFVFALISEIPFDLASSGKVVNWESQNVFFTLFFGLLSIVLYQELKTRGKAWEGIAYASLAVGVILAQLFCTDYAGGGVVLILSFFLLHDHVLARTLTVSGAIFLLYGGLENYAILSAIPILLYNRQRGPEIKYFFYFFYPAHLLILYGISL